MSHRALIRLINYIASHNYTTSYLIHLRIISFDDSVTSNWIVQICSNYLIVCYTYHRSCVLYCLLIYGSVKFWDVSFALSTAALIGWQLPVLRSYSSQVWKVEHHGTPLWIPLGLVKIALSCSPLHWFFLHVRTLLNCWQALSNRFQSCTARQALAAYNLNGEQLMLWRSVVYLTHCAAFLAFDDFEPNKSSKYFLDILRTYRNINHIIPYCLTSTCDCPSLDFDIFRHPAT